MSRRHGWTRIRAAEEPQNAMNDSPKASGDSGNRGVQPLWREDDDTALSRDSVPPTRQTGSERVATALVVT